MKRVIFFLLVAMTLISGIAHAAPIATTDATQIANFQNGATIITFEGISGITALTDQTPGGPVPAAAQLKTQIAGLTFSSNEAGGPVVLDLTGEANITDAKSQPNVLAGADVGASEPVLCFTCFIEVTFAQPVSRVGAFNDPTGGNVLLFATDLGGGTVFEQIQGSQGQFIGANTGINNIQRALFLFISAQSVEGFSLDDLTFARAGAAAVPEPTTLVLLGGGFVGLAWARRRLNRR